MSGRHLALNINYLSFPTSSRSVPVYPGHDEVLPFFCESLHLQSLNESVVPLLLLVVPSALPSICSERIIKNKVKSVMEEAKLGKFVIMIAIIPAVGRTDLEA